MRKNKAWRSGWHPQTVYQRMSLSGQLLLMRGYKTEVVSWPRLRVDQNLRSWRKEKRLVR